MLLFIVNAIHDKYQDGNEYEGPLTGPCSLDLDLVTDGQNAISLVDLN